MDSFYCQRRISESPHVTSCDHTTLQVVDGLHRTGRGRKAGNECSLDIHARMPLRDRTSRSSVPCPNWSVGRRGACEEHSLRIIEDCGTRLGVNKHDICASGF